jgi:hypothetical protein
VQYRTAPTEDSGLADKSVDLVSVAQALHNASKADPDGFGDESRKIRAGDVICCPTGGPETAHQIINDSGAELAYLSVSTMMPAGICEYPDSMKIGAFGGGLRHMTRANDNVDYWAGE